MADDLTFTMTEETVMCSGADTVEGFVRVAANGEPGDEIDEADLTPVPDFTAAELGSESARSGIVVNPTVSPASPRPPPVPPAPCVVHVQQTTAHSSVFMTLSPTSPHSLSTAAKRGKVERGQLCEITSGESSGQVSEAHRPDLSHEQADDLQDDSGGRPRFSSHVLKVSLKDESREDREEFSIRQRSSDEVFDLQPPAAVEDDRELCPEPMTGGEKTFKSEVVVRLFSGEESPRVLRRQDAEREDEDKGSEGWGGCMSPPGSEQSDDWSPRSSEEGAGRGKRADASSGGNLGLKEVEFKLDIGKRRLPSPDVKRTSVEKERAPEFVVKPRRQFVDEGQNAKFKVAFEGSPSTSLSWSRNGKRLESSSKFKMYEDGGYHYLEVCDVSKEDSGMYVGTVNNAAGTDTAAAELDVFEKPKLLTRGSPPPTLSSSLQDMDVVIGDRDVKLQCQVRGGERCTATWFHNGREVRQGRRHRCVFNGTTASLTLTEVGEDDGGEYQCVIKNTNGEVSTSCTVSTQEGEKLEPPVFVKELQDIEVEDGDKVELIVEVKDSDLDKEAEP